MSWFLNKIYNWGLPTYSTYGFPKTVPEVELNELKNYVNAFESKIDVNELNEIVLDITNKLCILYEFEDTIDIVELSNSSFKNFVARVYQIVDTIYNNPHITKLTIQNKLNFRDANIHEFYPLFNNILVLARDVSKTKRKEYYGGKGLNTEAHDILYEFSLKCYKKIKESENESVQETKSVQENNMKIENDTVQHKFIDDLINESDIQMNSLC